MSTAASAGMQAALLIREKQRLRRKKFRKGRSELPSHIATKEIGPFPQFPPGFMCSQGRAAWQERERGRRCSLSEEARQHRIKQTEAHHRWMKRNRIHDTSYGGGSDEEDFFSVYHQSAAANALLYVGLGTTAIGSVIFFVGTGEKGFKTLELRLIGPTLIACGLLCCLIRVLLCACPSRCFKQRRKKTRLKNNACPHNSSRYPLAPKLRDTVQPQHHHHHHHPDNLLDNQSDLLRNSKKKVSIVPPNHSIPSTSTSEFKQFPQMSIDIVCEDNDDDNRKRRTSNDGLIKSNLIPPQINLPIEIITTSSSTASLHYQHRQDDQDNDDSIIELQNFELTYDDIQSVSSNDDNSDSVTVIENKSKLSRVREPANSDDNNETSLSVVIEKRVSESDSSDGLKTTNNYSSDRKVQSNTVLSTTIAATTTTTSTSSTTTTHSGIVLSPLQLGQ